MADLPSFDDLPDHAPQASAPMSFDDLPHQEPTAPKAQAPAPAAESPASSPAPMDFDSLPHQAPAGATPPIQAKAPQGLSAAAQQFLQNNPARAFSLEASPIDDAQLAKAGTVGTAIHSSDKSREAEQLKNSAMGFFNARIQQMMMDMQAEHISPADQDAILAHQVEQWENAGLPAGKFNGANPNAFKGVAGEVSPREAWLRYANDIRTQGIANAQAPGAIFKDNGQLVVAKAPTLYGSELGGAAAVSAARSVPGIFAGNLGGEAGAAAGGAIAGTPGAIIGGIGGSLLGAAGGEDLLRRYAEAPENEGFRNGLEQLDLANQMGEEEHPIAAAMGRAGAQLTHNSSGIQDLIQGKGLTHALQPRFLGGVIGGGVEGASEFGRGDKLNPYKIGEAALSGMVFSKPRYVGEGPMPMSFEGRNWVDTNTPKPALYSHVDDMLRNGASPADVLSSMGNSLPDTPENRRALRIVSADIRHGRDPGQSMENITFRPNGLSVDKAVEAVNDHIKDWADAPKVQVHDSYDSDTIPADMKDQVGPGTLGWKDANGEIHIVASQHTDPAAITATMYHEGMHAGLARAYQGGLQDKLVTLYDGANPRLRQALTNAEAEQAANNPGWKKLSNEEQKALVTDEVLAGTAENGIHKGDFDKVAAFIRNFGRTRLGELGKRIKYSDAEVRQIMSTGYDAVSKGSGDATGPVRYMNFGVNSKTADLDSLKSYAEEDLDGKRAFPRQPEYPQGWFMPEVDDHARYEVSDKPAEFKQGPNGESPAELMAKPGATLGDVLHHPALFEAYPHLRDIAFKYNDDTRNNGSWSPKENKIYLSKNAKEPMGTLLHEVQHAIQDHEGWARGANDQAVYRTAPTEDIHKVIEEQIIQSAERADRYANEYHELLQAKNDPEWQHLKVLHDQYRHLEESKAESKTIDTAFRNYREAADQLRKSKGVDNPWDSSHSDIQYKVVQSKEPLDYHLERARKSWELNNEQAEKLAKAQGNEWDARALVRHSYEMSSKLYYRAGGEYEARATSERRHMTDQERLEQPQYDKMDAQGVHPQHLYDPLTIIENDSTRELVGKKPMRSNDNQEELPDQTFRVSGETLENPERGGRTKTIPNPDSVEWKTAPADTRFSRKYSGNFGGDYDSRQQRTEDLVTNHFGPVFNNVRGMMRPLAEYNRVTNDQVVQAAQELKDQGFDAGIAAAQGAIPDNSGFVVALKDLVHDKLNVAAEVAGRYKSSGGMRHERELMRAVTELGQVMSVFDKTASNLGRMLHALNLRINEAPDAGLQRMLDSIRFANGKLDAVELDKIATALQSRDPLAIRKAIDKFDPKWKQYAQSLFYNFILGSKSVQLGNIMGNATHIVQKGLGDVLGYGVGLGQEGAFRLGDKLGLDVTAPDRMHSDELMARTSGLLAGLMNKETYNSHRAFNTAAKEFFVRAGENEHENKFASQSIENLPMSLVLEYGTRGLQAADAFFRTVLEHSAMQGLATREARKLNEGKRPSTEQIADVMAAPTREMLAQVGAEADRMLFQEHPFGTAERFSRLMRNVPGGWIVAPIIRTPANIGRTAFETFDPTGRITQRNRDALKAGGVEANRVRGNQMLAAALWAGTLYLMQNNLLNGGGPSNPQARAQWLESHVPYTIGDAEHGFFPLRGISPIGDGLSTIADMRDAQKFGSKDPEMGKADKAMMVAAGMSDAYLSNSFLSSVTSSLERGVKPSIQNLLGTLVQAGASVPLYSQIKKEQDPFVRDTSNEGSLAPTMADKASLMDNAAMEHYFTSVKPRDELPIRRDTFGAPIMADHPTSTDPVAQEVGRLVDSTGKAVVPSFSRTSKGEHIPNDLYNSFMAVSGPVMREAVSQIMKDPVYQKTLNDEQRAALIRSNKNLKGLHARLNKQLQQMMLDRDPRFEGKFVPDDLRTLSTIPGEN